MKFIITQTYKGLYGAEFDITRKGIKTGYARLEGWTAARTGTISGVLEDVQFSMARGKRPYAALFSPYDPWNEWQVDACGIKGAVRHRERKTGIFKKTSYDELDLGGRRYQRYGIGLGGKGSCSPVWEGAAQAAQFTSGPGPIRDGLYTFRFAAKSSGDGLAALLLCLYGYASTCFRPGEITCPSIKAIYSRTSDPDLLKYYDPEFEGGIED